MSHESSITNDTSMNKYRVDEEGNVSQVRVFDPSCAEVVEAKNKQEAVRKFLGFACKALKHSPRLKVRNGAYQLAYQSMKEVTVEVGRIPEGKSLTIGWCSTFDHLDDSVASFSAFADGV